MADLLSLEPDLTRQEVSAILSETAMDRGKTGWDEYYGWGILNLRGCVLALSEGFRLSCRETENGQPCARAVNQTGEKAVCVLLSAGYDGDGRQTGVFMKTLCLPPGGQETVKLPKGTGKVFLCDEGFRPLTPALELGSASE